MRRAPKRLLHHFLRPITRHHSPSSPDTPTPRAFSSLLGQVVSFHGSILKPDEFSANLCRNVETLAEKPVRAVAVPSRQRKAQERSRLEDAFESASNLEEMLGAFGKMESCFEENELGLASLKVGLKLDQEGEDPGKVLGYAEKALKALDRESGGDGLPVAMALQLMGSACFGLNRFSDSLGYLNRANRILGKLAEDGSVAPEDVRPVHHAVLLELANVKTAMGRREEAIRDLRKCLEIKWLTFEEDSQELGKANRDVAEAYVAVLNFKEALPFATKALEIHMNCLGNNSVEVAQDRRLLGVIYSGLEEHEKALEQNQLSQKVLKNWGLGADLLRAEIDAANMQIALGRTEKAISTLKDAVQKTEKDSQMRALIFISMAKALCDQEKTTDAKRCLEIASGILDKREVTSPLEVAEAYSEISIQYETMNEFETAISLLKRALALLEKIPQEQHSEGSVSARIGWLLLLTGKVQQAIPYLECAAERLEGSFGSKHFGVGYIYNNLGAAYLELDRPQSAAQMFAVAKDIMDVALGPHHVDSIEACQNLSKAYGSMGSYSLAIEFQQQVIDAWENHGTSGEEELWEARRLLGELKKKAQGVTSSEPGQKALPMPPANSQFVNMQDID